MSSSATCSRRSRDRHDDDHHHDGSSDPESDSCNSPPRKKLKGKGAAVYGTKFNSKWESEFPFVSTRPDTDAYSFYCMVCKKNFNCKHQGIADVRRHEKSSGHQSRVKATRGTPSVATMAGFQPVGSALDTQVTSYYIK